MPLLWRSPAPSECSPDFLISLRDRATPEAQQERQSPAPAEQLLVRQHRQQHRPQPGCGERAGVGAQRRQRRDEAAALHRRVLGQHDRGAGDLRARPEPLDEPQHDEQDRRGDADHLVRREHADQRRRAAHQHDREEQDLLAADPVPHPSEVDGADEARDVPDAVGGHRGDQPDGRAHVREEDLVEDDGGGQRVQLEVHELHRRAEPAGHGGAAEIARRPPYGTVRLRLRALSHPCAPLLHVLGAQGLYPNSLGVAVRVWNLSCLLGCGIPGLRMSNARHGGVLAGGTREGHREPVVVRVAYVGQAAAPLQECRPSPFHKPSQLDPARAQSR